jgi:hypothetical protein
MIGYLRRNKRLRDDNIRLARQVRALRAQVAAKDAAIGRWQDRWQHARRELATERRRVSLAGADTARHRASVEDDRHHGDAEAHGVPLALERTTDIDISGVVPAVPDTPRVRTKHHNSAWFGGAS